MKILINKYILTACILLFAVSCSKSYMDTKPTDALGDATIFESVDNAQIAMNGVYKCMTQQYSGFSQGYNGEGTIKYYIGNYGGSNYLLANSGNTALNTQSYHDNVNSTFILYPWYYYYRLISNANSIIARIDAASGPEADKNFIKAQALSIRAYAYLMLSQQFHRRWIDGKTDEAISGNGLVLRLEPTTVGMPLSSAKTTYEQIYKDLDNAIAYFTSCGKKRSNNYTIDIDVAYAIYARAALTKLDYTNASKYAKLARANYPLMNNADYNAGFYTPTSEWIWSSYGGVTETLYYYSFFAYVAYNAGTSTVKNYPRCIYRPLFEKIPATDIRKSLFLDPKTDAYDKATGFALSNSALFKRGSTMRTGFPKSAKVAAWMQCKFLCEDGQGVGWLNHFRSSEMYLIEAEAEYKLNNETAARNALNALNFKSGRDPKYNCTATGSDLLEEIKLYRSIELWGEGFEYFDVKRWGDTIDRRGFDDGGNWKADYVLKITPDMYNGLTNVLPKKETDYSDALK